MTFAIEVHDSLLLDVGTNDDGTGFALFRGSIFRSHGNVFRDAQESGWQNVRFHFQDMRIEGAIVELGEYAATGNLWVNGSNENGVAFLPADHVGDICLELCLSPLFDTVKIYASRINSVFEGEFEMEATGDSNGERTGIR